MEGLERLSIFVGILVIMIVWEIIAPRRQILQSRWQRWSVNLGLSLFNMLIMRFTLAGAALWAAVMAQEQQWGLLSLIDAANGLEIVISLVLLDLAIYGQHRASHRWKWLWRLHKVHHTDLDFDVTTAVRFHPIEIILSMIYKVVVIFIIGVSIEAVFIFEVILSSCALFNHSNIKLPLLIDKVLRLFVVTPDMHRVHHSVIQAETDSNYGFSISVWDRLFNSYTDQPQQGHTAMTIGLTIYQHVEDVQLPRLLLMPFQREL